MVGNGDGAPNDWFTNMDVLDKSIFFLFSQKWLKSDERITKELITEEVEKIVESVHEKKKF